MGRLGALVAQHGMRGALVLQYSGPEVMKPSIPWYDDSLRLAACAQKAGIDVVDLLDGLRAAYKERGLDSFRKLWIMSDNNRVYGHMSPEGNELVAMLVAQKVSPPTKNSVESGSSKNQNK
jgi:hypothetical protein